MSVAVWPDVPGGYEVIDGASRTPITRISQSLQVILKRNTAIGCGIWLFWRWKPKADCRRQPRVSRTTHTTLGAT